MVEILQKPSTRKVPRIVWWVAGGLATGLLGLVAIIVYASWIGLTAEMNFQAMRQAIVATQIFVQENNGDWPRSWDDLKKVAPDNFDLDWAANHVEFDFDADPNELSKQTWQTFTGIKRSEPCFSAFDNELAHLIETLSKYNHE